MASRLGLTGPSGSRRRGAMLRRLLAAGDWVAIFAALCVATAVTSTTDVAKLFWAVLFTPAWMLVLKLHGLYDNDHRRIRHSTLDELPSLISASALGTIVLDGLLGAEPGRPALGQERDHGRDRRPARLLRRPRRAALRLAPPDRGRDRDRRSAPRRWPTWSRGGSPPIPRRACALVGYLSAPRDKDRRASLPRLGSIEEISRVARDHDVERVVVAEQEMGERDAEHLIEECKAAGLGLTFLPKHYGLLGPGDRAQPARRAAGARLPLLRPAALDPGDEAGARHRSSRA